MPPTDECPADLLTAAIAVIERDDQEGLKRVQELLLAYPGDARLHFLNGSLLAGLQHYPEAREAMSRAVEAAPGYAIARFQLGLLQLGSGDADGAAATWRPFKTLAPDDCFRLLSDGLEHMARDEFDAAVADIQAGMAANQANPHLNRDMQMVLDNIRALQDGDGEATSATHLLLQQYAAKPTKH